MLGLSLGLSIGQTSVTASTADEVLGQAAAWFSTGFIDRAHPLTPGERVLFQAQAHYSVGDIDTPAPQTIFDRLAAKARYSTGDLT